MSANNWTTNDYYQFKASMSGYRDAKVRFDHTSSSSGPAQFRVSYSTNGTSFANFTNYSVPKTNNTAVQWSSGFSNAASTISLDFSTVTNLSDASEFYVRILPSSTLSMTNGTVTTSGTSRIDNVTIEATTIGTSPDPKPVITSATTASGTAQSAFTYTITATNSPTYFSASGLPAGLGVDNTTGVISGTPTTAGTYSVLLTAGNASGDGTATLVITINPQPAPGITSSATASATVNVSFQYQITASNSPTSFGATGLPPGLSV
ncbi:MAG: putative Ig domain-containing protein, partial [Prosthecobacter sp.]